MAKLHSAGRPGYVSDKQDFYLQCSDSPWAKSDVEPGTDSLASGSYRAWYRRHRTGGKAAYFSGVSSGLVQ